MKLVNCETSKWTKIVGSDGTEIQDAVDRLMSRHFGAGHFGWQHDTPDPQYAEVGDEFRANDCYASGNITVQTGKYLYFRITQ